MIANRLFPKWMSELNICTDYTLDGDFFSRSQCLPQHWKDLTFQGDSKLVALALDFTRLKAGPTASVEEEDRRREQRGVYLLQGSM